MVRRWLLLLLCWLALPARAADLVDAQSGPVELRPGQVVYKLRPFADGLVRPERWSSLRLEIANGGDPTRASLALQSTGSDNLSGDMRTYARTVDLPSGTRKEVVLRYMAASGAGTRTAVIQTEDAVGRVEYPVRPLREGDLGIAVIGERTLGITAITEAWEGPVPGLRPRADNDGPRAVRVGLVPVPTLPENSAEWSVADWVVWPSPEPSSLDPEQLLALRAWVADGGHLLLTVTDSWRSLRDSPLQDLLPVHLEGTEEIVSLGPWMQELGGRPAAAVLTPAAIATPRPERRALVLAERPGASEGAPLWVAGHYGLGTVHVLLVDPSLEPLASGVDREALWRRLLWLPAPETPITWLWQGDPSWSTESWVSSGQGPFFSDFRLDASPRRALLAQMDFASPNPHGLYVEGESHYVLASTWYEGSDAEGWEKQVREYLQDIPGVAPLPLSWLLLFSGVYLFFIGPVDFLVLRALNRQPLTWVTFPVLIAVFSAVALVGTSRAKGKQAVLTRMEFVDVLGDTGLWRGDTYLGVWSTRKSHLSLRSGFDDAVVASLEPRGTMYDEVVRTHEGRGELEWRAETWTLAYARSRWITELPGRAWVEVLPEGGWRVHNDLGITLDNAQLVARGTVLDIGTLASGSAFTLKSDVIAHEYRVQELEQAIASLGVDPSAQTDVLSPEWAIWLSTERAERGRGHLDLYGQVALVGSTDDSIEPLDLNGLEPVPRAITVIRAVLQPEGGPR